ncbi:hypothetical protein, partial [Atlantibacter subterraneus]
RLWQQQKVLIAINRGDETRIELPWSPLMAQTEWRLEEGKAQLTGQSLLMPAISCGIWRNDSR